MKLFVYKTLFVFFCIFILFQFTVGMKLKEINYKIEKIQSKESVDKIKDKFREELKNAIEKENYLNQEDAKLINDFINKIKIIRGKIILTTNHLNHCILMLYISLARQNNFLFETSFIYIIVNTLFL